MNIQGIEINDDEIWIAGGKWERDKYCAIAIVLSDQRKPPLIFVSIDPEEANQMQKLLSKAVAIGLKNQAE